MGLDGVEIIMEVERDFGVRIEDAEAESLKRVSELQALLLDKLLADPDALPVRLKHIIFVHLQTLLSEQMNMRRSKIAPDSRFIEDLGL